MSLIKVKNILFFSGIGNHNTFFFMLKKCGLNIIKDIEFPDHYQYSEKDIDKICNLAKELNCKIITTEKDFLRIDHKITHEIKFVRSELKILNKEKFLNFII